MVELLHCYRPDSEYNKTVDEWYQSISSQGIKPSSEISEDGSEHVFLYHPDHPPDTSLTQYPCVKVNLSPDEISVRSWWTEDEESGTRSYDDWNPENKIGTEFLAETIEPDRIDGPLQKRQRSNKNNRLNIQQRKNISV